MSVHQIRIYEGQDRYMWRILTMPEDPKINDAPRVIAESSRDYGSRFELLKDLFSIFFGDYDESFLTLYAEWNPDNSGHAWQQAPRAASDGMSEIPSPESSQPELNFNS